MDRRVAAGGLRDTHTGADGMTRASQCSAGAHNPSAPGATPGPAILLALALAVLACAPAPRPPIPDLEPELARIEDQAEAAARIVGAAERLRLATDRAATLRPGPERRRAGRAVLRAHLEVRDALDAAGGGVCR